VQKITDSFKAVLIGINTSKYDGTWPAEDSLNELKELALTAGLTTLQIFIQNREKVDRKTYVGKGKLEEIKDYIEKNDIQVCITDDELGPAQHKHIEATLNIKVLDRTSLILDIFSQRAQTYEAQLQIELAQLNYLLPRLTRLWTHLSRQGGGIGSRGPGETQLESDKQQIGKKVTHLKKKLKKVQQHRHTLRENRKTLPVLTAALIGYTNAGKSTILNKLTNAGVLSEDKLFATLDPTSRQLKLPSHESLMLIDTVGFIQKLPHHLVNAFYSTLEEVTEADILLHVIDASHPQIEAVIETSQALIKSLHAEDTPTLFIFNKWDQVSKPNTISKLIAHLTPQVKISALKTEGLNNLLSGLDDLISDFRQSFVFHIPYSRMDVASLVRDHGELIKEDYQEKAMVLEVIMHSVKGNRIMSLLGKGLSSSVSK
jgi:GTPase